MQTISKNSIITTILNTINAYLVRMPVSWTSLLKEGRAWLRLRPKDKFQDSLSESIFALSRMSVTRDVATGDVATVCSLSLNFRPNGISHSTPTESESMGRNRAVSDHTSARGLISCPSATLPGY